MSRLLVVGFLSLLGQVVLLRELSVTLYGVELIYPLALGAWLLWTAAGVLASFRMLRPTPERVAALCILLSVLLPLHVALLRHARGLLGGLRGAYLPLADQAAILLGGLLLPGLCLGLLFQWAAKLYVSEKRSLALAYSIESAGAVVGGLAATGLLMAGIPNFVTMILCALVAAVSALAALRVRAALVLAGLLAVLSQAGGIDRKMTAWNHPHLVDTWDSPYGRVTVEELEGQVSVFENDALSFETEGTGAEELAHLAAIQHANPEEVLILGGATSGLVKEVAKHGPRRIDAVELNEVLVSRVLPHLPPDLRESLKAPNVRLHYDDPRTFLLSPTTDNSLDNPSENSSDNSPDKSSDKSPQNTTYDIILVGMPDPTSGQANRFYTRQFFKLCADRLRPDGVLAFRLSSSENYLPPPKARRLASICRAASELFSHLVVLPLPGATCVALASQEPLSRAPGALSRRLEERQISARLVIPPYVDYVYTNDRFLELDLRIRKEKELVPMNSDEQPICFQYTVVIWLSKFLPMAALLGMTWALRQVATSPVGITSGLALAGLFLASRWRPSLRRALLAAVAGFSGMLMETALILHYQVKNGVLFQDIGLLLMLFMVGLAAGALALDRVWHRHQALRRRWWGFGLLVAFAGFGGLWALGVHWGLATGLLAVGAGMGGTGFLVAAIFSYASLHGVGDQRAVISPLYASDLAGGCLAAVFGAMIAIPALGLPPTLAGAACLALLALLLV